MSEILVSVFTPTYNRGKYLQKAYESLCKSTYKNFEWVIADDGSTDNTENLVNQFKVEADFPIKYYKFPHGGKMRTMNAGIAKCDGEYFFELDSDDEIIASGIELLYKIWISLENPSEYYCVVGRCVDQNEKIMGDLFADNFNRLPIKKQNDINKSYHCMSLSKTEILKQYPFPIPEDCNFIPEAVVWRKIALKYKQFYTNIPCYKYNLMSDSSSFTASKPNPIPTYHYYIYFFNEIFPQEKNTNKKEYLIYTLSLCHATVRCKYSFTKMLKDLHLISAKFSACLCFDMHPKS